ncbi:ATP-binding protein [Agromyces sp. NPDC058484]|uniref:ATP-binding protein n=1 Tax=Agromyces sp. NPDC058484 TaxID=3346524 RepID=UPI00364E0979
MGPVNRAIRTPDQRLRVFVSSTLRELAPERRAVRAAIEQLNLAPVLFELGARPHPPRELYRAYLDQSDIFVGLYGESYGWVAPGDEVSGLEDEYLLAPHEMPKLVYVKEGGEREARLQELLGRIKDDDRVSYAYFTDAEQLAELARGDLATLLAERFTLAADTSSESGEPGAWTGGVVGLPAALTALVGRQRELETVVSLLADEDVRLVTLTGPGGIGKSRLSIEAANRVRDGFPGGIAFVDLGSVTDPGLVPAAIAAALGIRDVGDGTLHEKLRMAVRDRHMLLLLDNVEQVVEAAPGIRSLLTDAPHLTVLATSRILLRITGEHGVELGPLALPDMRHGANIARALAAPSVDLFVARVRAAKPDFELTEDNVEDVERICIALDGVPLAIELAAARARVLTPAELLERLDRRLLVLSGGSRDLPERQRTIRSTIEWSTQLLEPSQRELLTRLGLFAGGFSLDAAEWIADGIPDANTLDDLGALVDGSLVHQEDRGDRAVFSMLSTVREYALDQLANRADAAALRDRQVAFFVRLGEQAEFELEGADQLEWFALLAEESDNLRAAMRHLLDTRQWAAAAHFAWTLYVYWWIDGHLGEVHGWMGEVLDSGDELDDLTRATALYFTRAIAFWQDPDEWLVPGLDESAALFRREGERSGEALALISLALALLGAREPDTDRADEALDASLALFRESDDRWGEAMALVTLGRVALLKQDVRAALARFDESLAVAKRQHDDLGETIALHHRGWAQVLLGEFGVARACFEQSLSLSARLGHDEGVAYALEGLTAVAAGSGDGERAGTLFGAAQVVRERTGLYDAPSFSFHQQFVDGILAGPGAGVFEAARTRGRHLHVDDAVAYALEAA